MNIGHMMMALSALNLLKAERVIFIPSCNSIDKLDGLERIKMLKLAFRDFDVDKSKFMISPVEIKKEIHEPLDTISYFKKKYPEMKLLYLFGQDEISSLSSYKGIKEMKKLVKFIYVSRTGYEGNEELIKKYQMKKGRLTGKWVSLFSSLRPAGSRMARKCLIQALLRGGQRVAPRVHRC